jgi:hypothetical protein
MITRIEFHFDDGQVLSLSPRELTLAFLNSLQSLQQVQTETGNATTTAPCPYCQFGRDGDGGFCTFCKFGRDLARISSAPPTRNFENTRTDMEDPDD